MRRVCSFCSQPISKDSRTGLCSRHAMEVRREMTRRGLGGPSGPNHEEILEFLRAARGEVKLDAPPVESRVERVFRVAQETQRVVDWNANVLTLEADRVVVSSDVHVPRHDPESIRRVAQLGLAYDAEAYVVAGDLLDFEDLSTYPQPGPGGPDALSSLQAALDIMEGLLSIFPRILVMGGNHDVIRFIKRLDQRERAANSANSAIAALLGQDDRHYEDRYKEAMMRETVARLGGLASRVTWMPETHMYIKSPATGLTTAVFHQKKYSKRPPWEGLDLWTSEGKGCSVICTHTHGLGQARTPDGQHWLVQIGCNTRREWHHYATRHSTGGPEWMRGCALVWGGDPELFSIDSHKRKWEEVEARVAQREREREAS